MAKQLEALVKDRFKDLTYEQKLTFISAIRKSRRTPKATGKRATSRRKESTKKIDKLTKLFNNLSTEEITEILKGEG